jgi:hypothetical protein
MPRYRPENQAGAAAPAPSDATDLMPVTEGTQGGSDTGRSTQGGEIDVPATARQEAMPSWDMPTVVEKAEPPVPPRGQPYDARAEVEDGITTPLPIPRPRSEVRAEPRGRGVSAVLWALVLLSLLVSLASLALNGFLIYRLMAVQQKAVDGLNTAIAGLENLGGKGFHYNFHVQRTIPFSGDIPFKQDLNFPFEGNIPINTTVPVPIDAGLLGTFEIKVPINTNVRIKTSVPIHVDETIHVSTEVPIDVQIPIDIEPGEPAIQELISPIREWLIELRDSLE